MNLRWYTTEGTNCVSTNFSATGTQYLATFRALNLPCWWTGWYLQRNAGSLGGYAIGINGAPTAVPAGMVCKTCDANYYRSSNNGCTACNPITSSLAGSADITDCKCKAGFVEDCTLCPEGTYISDSSCHTCVPGSYCPIGSSTQQFCLAGSYCPITITV
jgi:hypothetical protein